VGQGALGLEIRAGDREMAEIISFLEDPDTRTAVTAERGFLAKLEGGCVVPVAALGRRQGVEVSLEALISDLDGRRYHREAISGPADEAAALGGTLAERLLARGGREILAELFATQP
jgi:hydroxymethylbilane synthase